MGVNGSKKTNDKAQGNHFSKSDGHKHPVNLFLCFLNTGIKAEALGETISSWDEVKEEDGMLRLFTYRLVRES